MVLLIETKSIFFSLVTPIPFSFFYVFRPANWAFMHLFSVKSGLRASYHVPHLHLHNLHAIFITFGWPFSIMFCVIKAQFTILVYWYRGTFKIFWSPCQRFNFSLICENYNYCKMMVIEHTSLLLFVFFLLLN